MDINAEEARVGIVDKFNAEGDFDFMKPDELSDLASKLIKIDFEYMDTLGDDDAYDEDVIYERLYQLAVAAYPQYKTYLMRFVDDYMDFMEEYLVSIGAVDWD